MGKIDNEVYNAPEDCANELGRIDYETILTMDAKASEDWESHGYKSRSIVATNLTDDDRAHVAALIKDLKEANLPSHILFDTVWLLRQAELNSIDEQSYLPQGSNRFFTELFFENAAKINTSYDEIIPQYGLREFINYIAQERGVNGVCLSPEAGIGSFAFDNDIDYSLYYGSATNMLAIASGSLLRIANGDKLNNYRKRKSSNDAPTFLADLAITNLCCIRWGTEYFDSNFKTWLEGPTVRMELRHLVDSFNRLSDVGRYIGIFSSKFLTDFSSTKSTFLKDDFDEREFTLAGYAKYKNWDNLDALKRSISKVILLPSKIHRAYKGQSLLVEFDKSKDSKSPVMLVDASTFFSSQSTLNTLNTLNQEKLIEAINDKLPGVVCYTHIEDLAANNWNLDPRVYLTKTAPINVPSKAIIRHLGDILNDNYVEQANETRVLLNRRGLDLLDTSATANAAYVNGFILDSHVSPEYFLTEISKEYIQAQTQNLVFKGQDGCFSLEQLKSIQIIVPVDKDDDIYFIKQEVQKKLSAKDAEYNARYEEFKREMRQRKHTLCNSFDPILHGIKLLDILPEVRTALQDVYYGRYKDKSAIEQLDALLNQSKRIAEMLVHLTDETQCKSCRACTIYDTINEYISSPIHRGNNFDYSLQTKSDMEIERERENYLKMMQERDMNRWRKENPDKKESEYKESITIDSPEMKDINTILNQKKADAVERKITVNINNEDFVEKVLDNIISNAIKYGFTDQKENRYKILFILEAIMIDGHKYAKITIANNGNPLAKNMTPEKIFEWGETTGGNGVGGYIMKETIQHYGGTIEVKTFDNDVDGYTIAYVIILPLSDEYGK